MSINELPLMEMLENEISTLDSERDEEDERTEMEVDLDDHRLMDEIASELPAAAIDFKKLGEVLTLNGGSITMSTEDYQLKLTKHSASTDIKVFFANSGMEIIGPEATFQEKAALIRSFLLTVTSIQAHQYASNTGDEDQAYA